MTANHCDEPSSAGTHSLSSELRHLRRDLRKRFPRVEKLFAWFFDVSVDTHLAGTFFALAVLASLFSWLAKSHIVTVLLNNGNERLRLHFGYLYEMNAGFFYIVVAPLFVISVTTVVRRLQLALVYLATRRRLVVLDEDGKARKGHPLVVIERCNRRVFSYKLLSILVLLPAFVVVGTEFMPVRRGDYWHVAFGYVQAPAIPSYRGTLADLKAAGRRVNRIDAIPNSDYAKWKLEEVTGGPRGAFETLAYWIFIALALAAQVLFLAVVLWGLAKVLLVLWIVYIGLDRQLTGRPGMAVHLDFEDPASAFGLIEMTRVYFPLLFLIALGMFGYACSLLSNSEKGSNALSADTLGFWGQGSNVVLPVTALAAFGAYVLMFYVKADAARDRYALSLDREYKGNESAATWEERRQRVVEQTLMPEGHLKAITAALGALVLLIKPEYMKAITYFWRNVLHLG